MLSPSCSIPGSIRYPKQARVENENSERTLTDREETPNVVDDDDLSDFDDHPDIVKLLEQRFARGVYCGKVFGTKVCISNLGSTFDDAQLANELTQHLSGVDAVRFAKVPIESLTLRTGHGCIEFDSFESAIKGMLQLETLYLDCPGSPLPRPILSHFPQRLEPLWGKNDLPGYILDHGVPPHFCQPNTFEYDVALEWRQMQKWLALSKKRLCDVYVKSICKELIEYKSHVDIAALEAVFQTPVQLPKSRTVVFKGVSTELKNEQIRNAVEVADYCGNIRRLECPVTGQESSTAFVEISSAERAASFAEDMKNFLFIMGRSPRPAEADIFRFGPPRGFEGIFDRAIESVFCLKMREMDPALYSKTHVIDLSSCTEEKKKRCAKIRRILDGMMAMRGDWKLESYAFQQDLHVRQKDWIDREMKKLEKLERVVPQFFDEKER